MNSQRILVTGGAGFLGWHLVRRLERLGAETEVLATIHKREVAFERAKTLTVDLTDAAQVERLLRKHRPGVIVHTAAMTSTGECEQRAEEATRANVEATRHLAQAAAALVVPRPRLIFLSTDLVFDGLHAPYAEGAATAPLMHYGRTKAEAEQVVVRYAGPWTILRTALMYGPPGPVRGSFLDWIVNPLRRGDPVALFTDEWRTPVWVEDVCAAILKITELEYNGILHCGGPCRLSRLEMGRQVAQRWGLDENLLRPALQESVAHGCARPRDVSLDSAVLARLLGRPLTPFSEALRSVEDCGTFSG